MVKLTKLNTGTDQLLCEIREKIALVTFNQPEKRNALGEEITPALRKTLALLENDKDVKVVIISCD